MGNRAAERPAQRNTRRYILRAGRWSDELDQAPQDRLAHSLVELSEQEQPDPLLEEWADFRIEGRILDLGCGTGHKSSHFTGQDGNRVVGCDFDFRLLRHAQDRFRLRSLVQCDAQELPFASGLFDWVISVEVVEHLEHPQDFLAEVRRVLRPGGRLLLTTPNRLQYLRPWRPWMFYLGLRRRILIESSHVREYSARELRALLPHGLEAARISFRGSLVGWPVPVAIQQVPQPFRGWWAQGIQLLATKTT